MIDHVPAGAEYDSAQPFGSNTSREPAISLSFLSHDASVSGHVPMFFGHLIVAG